MKTALTPARIAVSLAAMIIAAEPAFAADPAAKETFTFTYHLDRALLASPGGERAVYFDLQRKTLRACRLPGRGQTLSAPDAYCVAELIDKVVDRIGSEKVTAHHQGTHYYAGARRIEPDDSIQIVLR